MKNRLSDRKWIILILFFLIAEILWLLADLQIIRLPFFSKYKNIKGEVEAGHVIKITDELKRRSSNSLVWDNTKENDILYYNDSVLTLSQGAAKLYLKDQSELQLSENTLVTLEEPSPGSNSEIRLRFSKGDLKARNPMNRTSISGDDWVVNIEKGSEVSLKKDKESFEFEVLSGKAQLETQNGEVQNLTDSAILKLGNDQKIQMIEKNDELQWKEKKPLRVYVFEEGTQVLLDWLGSAQNLIINRVGEVEQKIAVTEEKSKALDLKLGTYKARLNNDKGVSTARNIEVLKAPRIYLKKPLPRDRLKIGESYEFIWTTGDGIKEYHLKVGELSETIIENFKTIKFDQEQDLKWEVEARDEDGYVIPSLYDSKIYIRKDPLQAPKLKPPTLRAPNEQKGTSFRFKWWNLLMIQAYASTLSTVEVVFEWEAVEGASQYTIEISSDTDFRRPEVIETVKSPLYVWKNYNDNKKYYWRVAAGDSKGRMGIFSEAIEFKPVIETIVKKTEMVEEPVAEPVVEKPVEPVITEKKQEAAQPSVETQSIQHAQSEEIPSDRANSGWSLAWAPSFKSTSLRGEQNTKINLQGAVPLAAQIEYKKDEYLSHLWLSSETWKPKNESETSLQKDLNFSEIKFYINKNNFGLNLHQSFIPLRKTDTTISYEAATVIGLRYSYENAGVSLGTSGKVHEANLDYIYKKYFSESKGRVKFFMGIGGDLLYQVHSDGGGYQGSIMFLIGVDSF